MAFTLATQTFATRGSRLLQAQRLLTELIETNDAAKKTWTTLTAQGVSAAEIKITVDKILSAGGDANQVAATTPVAFIGDTIADRLITLLISGTDGISWVHAEPT